MMVVAIWLLACSSNSEVQEETIWSATIETVATSSLHWPAATWPTNEALHVACEDDNPKRSPTCRLSKMYQCARNDMMRAYVGVHPNFGYVPLWSRPIDSSLGSCGGAGTSASLVREVVVAKISASDIQFHAHVEMAGRLSECVVRWGNTRLPDRLVIPGLDLALACATEGLVGLEPARGRFEDLVRSLSASLRLAGIEYEYKYGEISNVDEQYLVLVEEMALNRWWTVEEPGE